MPMNRARRGGPLSSSEEAQAEGEEGCVAGSKMRTIDGGEGGQPIPLAWDAKQAADAQRPTPASGSGRK